jgi:NAD(P)-dependent dehydrogenase (short-subunit alcohol dehydrogenase family)
VRDTELLNSVIEAIANTEGRMDGLIAAAGIQQETPALEYSAKDSNTMFEVNVTGVFMTAQAVAKQMIRFGNGGSIAMIASMSGTIANRVRSPSPFSYIFLPPLSSLRSTWWVLRARGVTIIDSPTFKSSRFCLDPIPCWAWSLSPPHNAQNDSLPRFPFLPVRSKD